MALCRICLVGDIRLLDLSKIHLEVFRKITNTELDTETEYGMPTTVCYVCHRLLQRLHRFSEMARTSNRILQDLLHNGNEVTHNTLKMQRQNAVLYLTLNQIAHWSSCDPTIASSTPVPVKDEPKLENFDEETLNPVVHLSINTDASSALVGLKKEEETHYHEVYDIEESMLDPLKDEDINDDLNKTEVWESDSNVNADINGIHSCLYCDVCNKLFYKKCLLVKHLQIHTKHKPYSCDRCVKSYTVKSYLTKHIKRIHSGEEQIKTEEKPYSCNRCMATFTRKHYLKTHMQIHTEEKPYSCNRCQRTFSQKNYLVRHIRRIHHSDKPYSCNKCAKTFNVKHNLVRHMQIHTGEKPYSCNICVKTYAVKSYLTRHIKKIHSGEKQIQTGEKPHSCNRCDKTFTYKSEVARHMRAHTGEKPYSCNRCMAAFTQKHYLKIHMQSHTGLKPYSCNKCEKTFSQKHYLVRHIMRIHNSEKPYSCNECAKTFNVKHLTA